MTKFYDILRNVLRNNKNEQIQEFAPLVKVEGADSSGRMPDGSFAQSQQVQIEPLQIDNNGQLLENPNIQPMRKGGLGTKLRYYAKNTRNKLFDALMGKSSNPTDDISEQNIVISENPRVGGLFNDLKNGYNENKNTAFDISNWDKTKKADGLDKGLAYRIGEGVGTLARGINRSTGAFGRGLKRVGELSDTPLGRAVIMGGLVGATGGNGLEMLAYGSTAGLTNQQNRLKDRLYRDELINFAQQSRMNKEDFNNLTSDAQQVELDNIANKIKSYRGYIGDETYKRLVASQQLRDNADWKKMYFDTNQKNLQAQREWQQKQAEQQRADRQAQFDYQKLNDAANRDLKYADLQDRRNQRAIDNYYKEEDLKLRRDTQEAKLNKSLYKNTQEMNATLNQIRQIRNYVNNNPKATGLAIGLLTGDIANRFDSIPQHIKTRTAIDDFRTKIRHDLTGAAFSEKEAKEYEKILPNTRDTKDIINAKLDALETKITGGGIFSPNINRNAVQSEMRKRGLL